jgi:hypothetical protein
LIFFTLIHSAKINHKNFTLVTNYRDTTTTNSTSFVYLRVIVEPEIGLLQEYLDDTKTKVANTASLHNLNEKSLTDLKVKITKKLLKCKFTRGPLQG